MFRLGVGRANGELRLATVAGCVVASLLLQASPAAAHSSPDPVGLKESFRIRVVGEVAPSCSLTREASFDVLDEVTGGSRDASLDLPFEIDCNSSFNMKLESRNGALDFDGAGPASSAFRRSIGYRAEVRLPGDLGGVMRCGSAAMGRKAGCATVVATQDVVQGAGSIKVLVSRDGQPLLRGVYSDTLTLTLQPRLGGGERD